MHLSELTTTDHVKPLERVAFHANIVKSVSLPISHHIWLSMVVVGEASTNMRLRLTQSVVCVSPVMTRGQQKRAATLNPHEV